MQAADPFPVPTASITRGQFASAGPASTRYRYSTGLGMISIEQANSGEWRTKCGHRVLGVHDTPEESLVALLQVHLQVAGGSVPAAALVPADLSRWAASSRAPR